MSSYFLTYSYLNHKDESSILEIMKNLYHLLSSSIILGLSFDIELNQLHVSLADVSNFLFESINLDHELLEYFCPLFVLFYVFFFPSQILFIQVMVFLFPLIGLARLFLLYLLRLLLEP